MTSPPAERLGRLGRWPRFGLAFLAGALMTAGQPPVSVPWALFFALPLLVWLLEGLTRRGHAFWLGWWAAFGHFTTGLYWIGHAFLVDAERFAWMMPFAVTLLPAFLGLFWGLAFWLAARGAAAPGWVKALQLAGWLTLVEYLRGNVLTGFPWGLPAYVWVETPLAQAAAWVGPFGLTLLTLVLAALPLVALASRDVFSKLVGAAAVTGFAALWIAGAERLDTRLPPAPDAPVLRVVQPNAIQTLKWDREWMPVFYRRILAHTAAAPDPALGPPDAVIWPETAVPFLPAEAPERRAEIAAAAGGAPVLLGALGRAPAGGLFTNSLMVMEKDRITARYDKHHLVPFGEYLPYPGVLGRLGLARLVPGAGFWPGPGPRVIAAAGLPPFAPQVCYEMIFPDEVVVPGRRPAWILQVTNDAWFGGFGGPQQHLAQARFRAIEQGLPVVRAANTGISAHIDARGRIRQAIPLDSDGWFDMALAPALPPTLYARTGDWPSLAIALLLSTLGFIGFRYHS